MSLTTLKETYIKQILELKDEISILKKENEELNSYIRKDCVSNEIAIDYANYYANCCIYKHEPISLEDFIIKYSKTKYIKNGI